MVCPKGSKRKGRLEESGKKGKGPKGKGRPENPLSPLNSGKKNPFKTSPFLRALKTFLERLSSDDFAGRGGREPVTQKGVRKRCVSDTLRH